MTLFLNAHTGRLAPGSFQQPVPIPASLPGSPDLVSVCFNRDWLPYVLGSLFQLTLSTTWLASTQDELNNALQMANDLILIFQLAKSECFTSPAGTAGADGEDFMLRQDPDNPCLLQSSVDGVTWCTWADLSKCNGQPMQPGNTTPNPGAGGCTTEFGTVIFGSKWLLPFPVSAGDQITISNAVGSWSGLLDLGIPRCPDGNIFFNVSGINELDACVDGTAHTEPGDPAPTINHDSLIGFDGTNYYDFGPASNNTPVTITIPPGITNANFYLMPNTTDTVGFGSVQFDAKYCNNAAPTWTQVFDFTANTFSFTPTANGGAAAAGIWTAGSGWGTSDVTDSAGTHYRRILLTRTFAAPASITSAAVTYDFTPGTFDFPSVDFGLLVALPAIGGTAEISQVSNVLPTGVDQVASGMVVVTTPTGVQLYLASSATAAAAFSGSARIAKLVLTGTGNNPFTGP